MAGLLQMRWLRPNIQWYGVNEEGWAELQLLVGAPYEIRAEAEVRGTGSGRATIDATATEVTVVLN